MPYDRLKEKSSNPARAEIKLNLKISHLITAHNIITEKKCR